MEIVLNKPRTVHFFKEVKRGQVFLYYFDGNESPTAYLRVEGITTTSYKFNAILIKDGIPVWFDDSQYVIVPSNVKLQMDYENKKGR